MHDIKYGMILYVLNMNICACLAYCTLPSLSRALCRVRLNVSSCKGYNYKVIKWRVLCKKYCTISYGSGFQVSVIAVQGSHEPPPARYQEELNQAHSAT